MPQNQNQKRLAVSLIDESGNTEPFYPGPVAMVKPYQMSASIRRGHLRQQHQRHAIEPIAMRVPNACRYLGIGRSTLYVLIGKGEVEVIKLGSSTLVLTSSLRSLVEQRRMRSKQNKDHHGAQQRPHPHG